MTGGKAPVSIPPFIIIAFELTILFGGLATPSLLLLGRLPKLGSRRAMTRASASTASGCRWPVRPSARGGPRCCPPPAPRRCGDDKKSVLLLSSCAGAVGAVLGGALGLRWQDNMTVTQRVKPGERDFAMPTGSLPRDGGRALPSPGGAGRGGGPPQPGGASRVGEEGRGALGDLLHALPRGLREGRRAGDDQVRPPGGPDQSRPAQGAE